MLNRRLQTFRHLHACSGYFRLEHLPGGACTHWKAPPFHGARHEPVDYVAALTQTQQHYTQIVESLKPQGAIGVIDDMAGLDVMALKSKALSLHWELMFTRSMFGTPDMAEQGKLLGHVAQLVDAGRIRTTAGAHFGTINAANLLRAHAWIESGKAQGKVVLEGF